MILNLANWSLWSSDGFESFITSKCQVIEWLFSVYSEAGLSMFPVALGLKRTRSGMVQAQRGTCILCQEEQEITLSSRPMVLTAFVQK